MNNFLNIADVVETGTCVGCGTCAGICPKKIIIMVKSDKYGHYVPVINGICSKCYLCLEVCPAYDLIFYQQPIDRHVNNEKHLIGRYLDCYRGYALSESIRAQASSGGLIPAILSFMLQKDIIDGALLVRMKKDNPLEAEPFIARSKDEILKASGSKYCPVAFNTMLRYILDHPGRYAVVGLPCQIVAIRKAQKRLDKIASRILFVLGLFCNHTPTFNATEYLLMQMKITPNDVSELRYRSGWANCASVLLKNGVIKKNNMYWHLGFGSLFHPVSCSLCKDHTSEMADISFGDAWLPEIDRNNLGESIIVVRTNIGRSIIHSSLGAGTIFLESIRADRVVESQKQSIIEKKRWVDGRLYLASRLHIIKLPGRFCKWVGLKQVYRAFLSLGKYKLGKTKKLWKMINIYYMIASYIYKKIRLLLKS